MTKEEIKKEVDKMTKVSLDLMGTMAYHQLGDLSRDEDLFYASGETNDYYIGSWCTGYGFFNVCFPKKTSRALTDEEVEKYNKSYVQLASQPPQKLNVRND